MMVAVEETSVVETVGKGVGDSISFLQDVRIRISNKSNMKAILLCFINPPSVLSDFSCALTHLPNHTLPVSAGFRFDRL